ncbi:MAG TPA: SDR family oxidoreductase [Sphingomonadales bacterium]|nr:SDR family oxidoreductase [Sphingomonadales bacterium]
MSKRVIITGAGSGIGRAIAECFHDEGAQVVICDVSEKAMFDVTRAHDGINGIVADVGEYDQVKYFIDSAVSLMGGVDVLVNNAGIGGPRALVEDIQEDDWAHTLQVNLTGMYYCIKEVVPEMKAQRHGSIINISTGSTRTGLPHRMPYVVSKAAVNELTHTLAREVGPFNIRCNAILPGAVQGARGDRIIAGVAADKGISQQEAKEECLRYISMRTDISPTEIGEMACFLASNRARHVTGQLIGVCGNVEWEE